MLRPEAPRAFPIVTTLADSDSHSQKDLLEYFPRSKTRPSQEIHRRYGRRTGRYGNALETFFYSDGERWSMPVGFFVDFLEIGVLLKSLSSSTRKRR